MSLNQINNLTSAYVSWQPFSGSCMSGSTHAAREKCRECSAPKPTAVVDRSLLAGATSLFARRRYGFLLVAVFVQATTACLSDQLTSIPLPPGCEYGRLITPDSAALCLFARQTISAADRDSARTVFAKAASTRDSLSSASSSLDFTNAAYLTRALATIGDFYSRGLFADSARFHRMTDQVSVTLEQVDGTLPYVNGHGFPRTTPYLAWKLYINVGIYFQPVETSQLVGFILPRPSAPTDSVVQIAEHLYKYALWRTYRGERYPVWEYEFPWSSGGVSVTAPWLSGMAQSTILMVFADSYRRTGEPRWRQRAFEVLRSLYVPWDQGGVLLPDTLHGFWWEEYHPVVQVWNGAAQALLGVGYFYSVTNDPEVKRVYDRGIEAMKYYTPLFDTGEWTVYSRTQGLNTAYYHDLCIQLMDALYAQSSDSWFKEVADRWRTYTPPPGIQ